MEKVLLIVNPVAGKMKAKTTLLDVVTALQKSGESVTVFITQSRGDAVKEAALAEKNGFKKVVCFGGDGTLNETINGLMQSQSDIPLGYIPAGSTNDFAASMKLPSVPKKSAELISKGEVTPIDVGFFDEKHYFTYVAAFGVFTAASYSVTQDMKNIFGHMAYILGGVKEIGNIRSYHVKITMGDRVIEDDYMFGAVANSTSLAGIVKLNESLVDMSDGEFEIGLIKKPKTIVELNKIITALTTSKFENGGIEFYKASEIVVESEGKLDWTLDGEHAQSNNRVVIKNLHNAVNFIK